MQRWIVGLALAGALNYVSIAQEARQPAPPTAEVDPGPDRMAAGLELQRAFLPQTVSEGVVQLFMREVAQVSVPNAQIETIVREELERATDEVELAAARRYAHTFSATELRTLKAFFETPAGQAVTGVRGTAEGSGFAPYVDENDWNERLSLAKEVGELNRLYESRERQMEHILRQGPGREARLAGKAVEFEHYLTAQIDRMRQNRAALLSGFAGDMAFKMTVKELRAAVEFYRTPLAMRFNEHQLENVGVRLDGTAAIMAACRERINARVSATGAGPSR